MAAKIRKGDTVQVIAGKNRGMTGSVLRVNPSARMVVVERVNLVKKHQRPSARHRQGGIIEKEMPLPISNVVLVHNAEPTRVGFRTVDGRKVRWSKKLDEAVDD